MEDEVFTEVGIEINTFKFALKLPKFHMSRPRLFRKRPKQNREEEIALQEEGLSANKVSSLKSGSNSSKSSINRESPGSLEWINDFHQRYNPIVDATKRKDPKTSTPLSLAIKPLNVYHQRQGAARYIHNLSGVKIYDDEEFLSDKEPAATGDDSYELVIVNNNNPDKKLVAQQKAFSLRSLKHPCAARLSFTKCS